MTAQGGVARSRFSRDSTSAQSARQVALGFGELGQGFGVANAGKVGVFLPMLKCPVQILAGFGRTGVSNLGFGRKLGAEPCEGLATIAWRARRRRAEADPFPFHIPPARRNRQRSSDTKVSDPRAELVLHQRPRTRVRYPGRRAADYGTSSNKHRLGLLRGRPSRAVSPSP